MKLSHLCSPKLQLLPLDKLYPFICFFFFFPFSDLGYNFCPVSAPTISPLLSSLSKFSSFAGSFLSLSLSRSFSGIHKKSSSSSSSVSSRISYSPPPALVLELATDSSSLFYRSEWRNRSSSPLSSLYPVIMDYYVIAIRILLSVYLFLPPHRRSLL